jgi:CHASE3 domain sensor protein
MSSESITPVPAGRLARKVRMFILGLLLASLLGALGLLFAGYRVHRLRAAVSDYADAAQLHRSRTEAIRSLNDMENAFNRFLLDGNSANLTLAQRDKETIERLAHQDAAAKNDKLVNDLAARAEQWYTQVAQPLIERRKNLPAGQGLSEDFLTHYRASGSDPGAVKYELETQRDYNSALQGLQEAQQKMSFWVSLAFLAVAVGAGVFGFAMASGALKHTTHLKDSVSE